MVDAVKRLALEHAQYGFIAHPKLPSDAPTMSNTGFKSEGSLW